MSRPYKEVKAGEPILAQDWNAIQSQIHEHILTHTHTGTGEAGAKIDVDIRALAVAADMSVRKLNAGEGLTVGPASQPLLAVNPAATNQEGNYHVNVAGTLRAEQVRTGRLDGITTLAVGDLAISGSAGIGIGMGTSTPGNFKLKVEGGDTYLGGTLAVGLAALMNDDLTVTGATRLNGPVIMDVAAVQNLNILGTVSAAEAANLKGGLTVTGNTMLNGNIGIGTPTSTSRLHIDNGRVDITTSEDSGGGQNRFSGLTAWNGQGAYRRAQLVISSSYSDLVIASSKSNNNHGSTLTFATSNPDDATQYRKWVINQGNWGDRKQFLDFGYGDANGRANPHDNINGTETVLTLDGVNKRVGIGTTSPSAKLEVNGLVAAKILKVGGGVEVDMFDDGALSNRSSAIPTAKAVKAYVDAQIAQLKGVFDKHQHKYVHYTYRDIANVNVQNVSDTQVPNPT